MFITLLTVTFAISFVVAFIVVRMFNSPVNRILHRIIDDDISSAWSKYLLFALYVVGISSGVRIWELEKYITPNKYSHYSDITRSAADSLGQADSQPPIITLNFDRWVLEVYRTIIETLQGIAWTLLVFFIIALIAYVIVRATGGKKIQVNSSPDTNPVNNQ